MLFIIDCKAQTKPVDPYASVGLSLIKSIDSKTKAEDLESYFDSSLHGDLLKEELTAFINEVLPIIETADFYTTKINYPGRAYNTNIHNPVKVISYGDLRFLFKDEKDFLIDDWKYIKKEKQNESPGEMEVKIPPPPPPPPGGN